MNLLERTRRLLQGLAPPPPAKVQYYSVACSEGHRLRGERTEGYQALRCPTCGEGIFVLPRSPLPEPIAPTTPRTARAERATEPAPPPGTSRREREREDDPVQLTDPIPIDPDATPDSDVNPDVDGDIEWLEPAAASPASPAKPSGDPFDYVEPETESPARAPRASSASTARPGRSGPRVKQGSASHPGMLAVGPSVRERLVDWTKARRNPLIFLAVGLIVVMTIGVRTWRSRFQDFPRIAERGRVEGLAALDSGDFDTAHKILSAARRAVDSLGGAVEGADEIRHGADEAALFSSQLLEPLESILADASPDPQDSAWSTRFEQLHKGRAIIVLDAQVTEVPDASGSGKYELDYRILPPGEGDPKRIREGRLDLSAFRLFELARPRKGDIVRFAGRLASLRLDTESRIWQFALEPDGGVFLTHRGAIDALIGTSTDDDREVAAP